MYDAHIFLVAYLESAVLFRVGIYFSPLSVQHFKFYKTVTYCVSASQVRPMNLIWNVDWYVVLVVLCERSWIKTQVGMYVLWTLYNLYIIHTGRCPLRCEIYVTSYTLAARGGSKSP